MKEHFHLSRRGFIKIAGMTAGCALAGLPVAGPAAADAPDFVQKRQESVYRTDAKVYKIRKSQDNPMVQKLYAHEGGFLHDGPCGHMSHHLLHTHYIDRSARIQALKDKGFELSL